MTIEEAVLECQGTGLSGWDLVAYTQALVNRQMTYSYSNSLDTPDAAFEKGEGYCWHQASSLSSILTRLCISSRLVHAFKNKIPDTVRDGVTIKAHISGHMWCRVTIDGEEKDVCPGHPDNRPGVIHFRPVSPVREWGPVIAWFSYHGSALVNKRRLKRFEKMKQKQKAKWNPELCPCRKKKCPRYKNCDVCKEYHYDRGGLPYCERP